VTLRELVIEAIEKLMIDGYSEFTASDICEKALEIDPSQKRRSILGTLPGLIIGRRHPVYTLEDQFLERVRHGVYKLCDLEKKKKMLEEEKKKKKRWR